MEGIKFLNDDDVKDLFSGSSDNQDDDGIVRMSAEDTANMFNKKEEQKEDDDEDKDEDFEEEHQKSVTQSKSESNQFDYNTIAKNIAEEYGLDEDIEDADEDTIRKMIKKAIENGIDEETKQIRIALENGVDARDIQEYKNTIEYLHSIKEDDLFVEDEEGDLLRSKLIMQDFLNQGLDEKEAKEKTKEIFKDGKDIDAAKKALKSNKDYFQSQYKELLDISKKKADDFDNEVKKQTNDLKDSIFSDDKYLGEIDLDEKTKKLALKNISEPIYMDRESGQMLTKIQKYEKENRTGFLKNLTLLFTLTDGFTKIDKLVERSIKKRMAKEIENVEDALKNPSRNESNLTMVRSGGSNRMAKFKFDI